MDNNGTYKKMRNNIQKAQEIIKGYYSYVERYMRSGIEGHEWEFIELARDTIAEVDKALER